MYIVRQRLTYSRCLDEILTVYVVLGTTCEDEGAFRNEINTLKLTLDTHTVSPNLNPTEDHHPPNPLTEIFDSTTLGANELFDIYTTKEDTTADVNADLMIHAVWKTEVYIGIHTL